MAIAFRSVGARLKVDISASTGNQNVPLPAGHVSGDYLMMAVIIDSNNHPTTPSGWTLLGRSDAGNTTGGTAPAELSVYQRIDNGSLGSNVTVTFSTEGWPDGNPYVLAWCAAYTGVDTAAPVETWSQSHTLDTTAAQAHPQLTTSVANDWVVTLRASSGSVAVTFTDSVGTDSERVDDTDGFGEMSGAHYDSNAALAAGVQTQRTTTASALNDYGSCLFSIALKPTAVAGSTTALPEVATAAGTAYDASVAITFGPWDLCTPANIPVYSWAIDWANDGTFSGTGEDCTADILSSGIQLSYGRDQSRQLSPASIGTASFVLNNSNRTYSPDNVSSPLSGNLDPARPMRGQVTYGGTTFPLFRGRINEYTVQADRGDRTASFTFLDMQSSIQGNKLSTEIFLSIRTGEAISKILDLVGWTGGRDIDPGATIIPFWWLESTDALAAIQDLVKSEGPPAIAYAGPDNTFVFRDRHHRILRTASITSQATFSARMVDCAAPAVTGFDFTAPFAYENGWRDIVNSVAFEVGQRAPSPDITVVWTSDSAVSLSDGETTAIGISASDPFINAIVPVVGTDYVMTTGVVSVTLSKTSGQSATIYLTAVGGPATLAGLQLRAQAIPVARTVKVSQRDPGSIAQHGEQSYPEQVPWANYQDAFAITSMILLQYSERRPTVQLRIVSKNPAYYMQVLGRSISDRIHITNNEVSVDDDFFVERLAHQVERQNQAGLAPVHSLVMGCEKQPARLANPFTFDKRGAGFDEGVFEFISPDSPTTVFIFDDLDQGVFDVGVFGT
jgi:hypothetical protein